MSAGRLAQSQLSNDSAFTFARLAPLVPDTLGCRLAPHATGDWMAVLRFGDFHIDCDNKRLWRGDDEVELRGLPFTILCYFVQGSAKEPSGSTGLLVSKADLARVIWQGARVSDETVRGCIRQIRRALDEDPQAPQYLKTHAKEGWRWLMPVSVMPSVGRISHDLQPPDGPYDPNWYVERPQLERELLSCLSFPGRPAVIYGPQGSGKSTLIARALNQLAQQSVGLTLRVVRVNLRALDVDQLASLDGMLQALALWLLSAVHEDEDHVQQQVSAAWARTLDPRTKLKRLLRAHLFSPDKTVVLVFSEVDALVPWPYQAAWFDLLRSWQDDEALSELRLILASAIPPRLFPLSEHSPLWTKAARLDATMISIEEARQLARLHGLPERQVDPLRELVAGSARLLRTGMFRAAMQRKDLDTLLRDCVQAQGGVFAEHLADIDQWLDGRPDAARIIDALRREPKIALTPEQAWPFLRKGLLCESEQRGYFVLRCPLYAQRFSRRSA